MTHATSLMISEPRYSMLLRIWDQNHYYMSEQVDDKTFLRASSAEGEKTKQKNSISHKTVSHLCSHDKTRGGGVDGDVSCDQTHILKLLIHLSVLLIGERLDWACEDDSLLFS